MNFINIQENKNSNKKTIYLHLIFTEEKTQNSFLTLDFQEVFSSQKGK